MQNLPQNINKLRKLLLPQKLKNNVIIGTEINEMFKCLIRSLIPKYNPRRGVNGSASVRPWGGDGFDALPKPRHS